MNSGPQRGSRKIPKAKSFAAFSSLKREIMLGELSPGQTLTELDLAAQFGCSQGTVREALLQLQDEGLVVRKGYRGTQVSECTPAEAVELFRIRQSIECRGILRVIQHPSRTLIKDLRSLINAMVVAAERDDDLELASIDGDFHRRLFADADLPALEPILHRCLIHNLRSKMLHGGIARTLMESALRHEPIVAAVERKDTQAAVSILGHHVATIVDIGPDLFPETDT